LSVFLWVTLHPTRVCIPGGHLSPSPLTHAEVHLVAQRLRVDLVERRRPPRPLVSVSAATTTGDVLCSATPAAVQVVVPSVHSTAQDRTRQDNTIQYNTTQCALASFSLPFWPCSLANTRRDNTPGSVAVTTCSRHCLGTAATVRRIRSINKKAHGQVRRERCRGPRLFTTVYHIKS